MKTVTITIEDDGNPEDESIKVVFGHSEEEAKKMIIMPVILSATSFLEHQMVLADKCIKFNYPHLKQFSPSGQDKLLRKFNAEATLENLQYPGTYNPLTIIQ